MTTIEYKNEEIISKDPDTNLYTCTTCSYYTPLKNSFAKHLKTEKHQLNIKPLACEHCKNLFHTKISYNNHVKSCLHENINEPEPDHLDDTNSVSTDVTICDTADDDEEDDHDQDEDLSVLLSKFGNEYDKLMIKYMLLFLLIIKEHMVPVNILLIFVFFMWTR